VYEAMACGAISIVSPLETIKDIVDDTNVLFANNLDQPAIERAIVRVMNDDALVDEMTRKNLDLVKKLADIKWIKPKVQKFYEEFSR
jgi:glycosyltransferase involved in cell wall biosynthesis